MTYRGNVSIQRLSVLLYPDEVVVLMEVIERADYSPALQLAYEQLELAKARAEKRVSYPRTLTRP